MNKKILIMCFLILVLIAGCNIRSSGRAYGDTITDEISIEKTDIKECCTYQDSSGNEKKCTVLERYDCSYCDDYCKE
jgi:hypothetical protein